MHWIKVLVYLDYTNYSSILRSQIFSDYYSFILILYVIHFGNQGLAERESIFSLKAVLVIKAKIIKLKTNFFMRYVLFLVKQALLNTFINKKNGF